MNLWVKQTGLILGLALFIFACEEPGEINLGLNPEQENFVISSVEIPVDVAVGWADPYLLYDTEDRGLGSINIGKYVDPRFGTITSSAYAQVVVSRDTIRLPTNATYYKSQVKLFVTNIYPDLNDLSREQIIRIHELMEEMDSTNYSNTTYEYKAEPLAEVKFHLDSMVSGLTATADFPEAIGKKIFDEVKSDSILTDKELSEIIKGVTFIPDENNNMLFSLYPFDEVTTGIEILYRTPSDTLTLRYLFEGIHSNHVVSQHDGTELAALQQGGPPIETTEFGYLNSFSGIFAELDLSQILELKDTYGNAVVNSARLYMSNALEDTLYRTPSNIYAYNSDSLQINNLPFFIISENRYLNLDKIGQAFLFGLTAGLDSNRKKNGSYSVNLTFPTPYTPTSRAPRFEDYIQNLILGNTNSDKIKIILTPSSFGRSFNQLVFDKNSVKLKIYFSYLKDQVGANN